MLSSRLLLSATIGFFCLALGAFALHQNPRRRSNRYFALHNFAVAIWFIFVGPVTLLPSHDLALFLYRMIQIAMPVHSYFLLCFIQDLCGVFDTVQARRVRRAILAFIVLFAPLFPTSLLIENFSVTVAGYDAAFTRTLGPLYVVNLGLFLVLFGVGAVTSFNALRGSAGLKRNQMLFVALGSVFGLMAAVSYLLSFFVRPFSWMSFPFSMAMSGCFAYTIFKYQLLDFSVAMKRLSISAVVYLPLLALPLFLFFPFRDSLPGGPEIWPFVAAFSVGYAVIFSLAPFLTSYLRARAEKAKWEQLHQHLAFVRHASERLTQESGLTLEGIGERVVEVFRELYEIRMETPLRFISAVMVNNRKDLAVAIRPHHAVESDILNGFLRSLQAVEGSHLQTPFSRLDVESWVAADANAAAAHRAVGNYLRGNDIEICAPCVHDREVRGAVLFGPKEKGIFTLEELAALQLTANQAAAAVRKSELLATNRELKNLDKLKTELISNITHEFKTPLYITESALDVLLNDLKKGALDPDRATDYLLMIQNNVDTLGGFIRDLLDVARIEQAAVELQREDIDLNDVLRNAAQLLRPLAEKKKLPLSVPEGPPLSLSLDASKITAVFSNLLSNAIKFTETGEVAIDVCKSDASVQVRVRDTGCGIEEADLSRVFEKFFQIRNGHSPEGTGLGLAIARGWVEAHGGRIWAESKGLGHGAAFIVELPLSSEEG